MFTGIIESVGKVVDCKRENSNLVFEIESSISSQLKIDQSVAHNGVCLTVVFVKSNKHKVVAVNETLQVSNLKNLKQGDEINLERALKLGDRLDGHMVQGHVDATATCKQIGEEGGSYRFTFLLSKSPDGLIIPKGSVCINGVSLTITSISNQEFSVAIIPYTFENTIFNKLKVGDTVNIEFDMIGKYLKGFSQLSI